MDSLLVYISLFLILTALSGDPAGTGSGKYKDFSIRECIKYLESYQHLRATTSPTYLYPQKEGILSIQVSVLLFHQVPMLSF